MPGGVCIDETAFGDHLPALPAGVVQPGPGELRAIPLAAMLGGYLGVREDAHLTPVFVAQYPPDLVAVVKLVAMLFRIVDDRCFVHGVAPRPDGISIWKAGSNRAFSTTPPGA